jgi:hypothetical protein
VPGLAISFVLVSTACLLPPRNQADGASCSDDDECKSERCNQGYCLGSTCKPGDSSSCDSGWKCVHSDPDFISGFFGADGSDRCEPTCGSCPGNSYCAKGDKVGESLCTFGKAPLDITIEAPRAVAGQPARLVAVAAAPAGAIVKCQWETGDGQPGVETPGPELTHVFEAPTQQARISATCTDDGGRIGTGELHLEVVCQPSGEGCVASYCCEGETHCVPATSGSGTVCRAPLPPTLTVSGPNPIPVDTEGEYTASVTGGEGELRSVTWQLSTSAFTSSGLTFTEFFSDPGVVTLNAKAVTTLDQKLETTYSITVCQVENGRCSSSEPCCAPLSCKVDGAFSRCEP